MSVLNNAARFSIAAIAFTTPAFGAGFSTVDRSVVAMGSGGAGAARADDPAANVYNPAATAMSSGFFASAGLAIASADMVARGPGWTSETDASPVTPPMLHVGFGTGTLTVGASLTVPFGSRVAWPSDWPGRFEIQEARLSVLRTSAFAAMRFDRFAFAAGPFVDRGSLTIARAIDFIEAEGKTRLDTRATGLGMTLAAFARPIDELDLGLTYHSRSKLSFSGFADFDVPAELRGRAHDQEITTSLSMPDRITFGALYRINDELEVLADLEVVLWSTVDALVLDFQSENTTDVVQRRDWKTTVAPRIGASWSPSELDVLRVRAGAFLDPSPVPSETAGPSSPDSTRIGLTLGLGLAFDAGFTLDTGYQLLLMNGVESSAETASLAAGISYAGHVHLFGAALGWRGSM